MANKTIQIIITALDKASGTFEKVGASLKSTGDKVKGVGMQMSALSLPIAGVGIAAAKMSMDFEKSMSNVSTLVDTSVESMDKMKKEVLDLAQKTPVAIDDLTVALYNIRSAGIDAAGAMDVLENSAKLSAAGLGSTTESVDLVTSAINAFGIDSTDSARVADIFFKTVKAGKTTVSELAQGFGQIAPLANEMNVSIEELMSNTAAMTTSGMKASIAYSQQRAAMSNLLKPTAEMQQALDLLGITDIKAQLSSEGFNDTLRLLKQTAEENNIPFAKMMGSVEGLNAALMITGETGEMAGGIFQEMSSGANALEDAFKKQQETVSAQAAVLKNKLNAALIQLGDAILPVIVPLVSKLGEWVGILTEKFSNLSPTTKKIIVILGLVVAAIGPILIVVGTLVSAIGALMPLFGVLAGVIAFLASPIGLIILAIMALIAVGYLLYSHWDAISAKAIEVWGAISSFLKPMLDGLASFFNTVWTGIKNIVIGVFNAIATAIQIYVAMWIGIMMLFLNWLFPNWQANLTAVYEFLVVALDWVKSTWETVWTGISDFFINIWNGLITFLTPIIETFKTAVRAVLTAVKDTFNLMLEPIKKAWSSLWDSMKNIASSMVNTIGDIAKNIINAIIDKINWAIEKINAAKKSAGALGAMVPDIPRIPKLASGGIVTSPTIAMIGEAGPEAVVPLGKGGGFGGFIVNVMGGNYLSEDAAEQFGDILIKKLKQNMAV